MSRVNLTKNNLQNKRKKGVLLMKKTIFSKPGHRSRLIVAGLVTTLILLSALSIHAIASIQSSLGIAGYRVFSYETTTPADVTGEKPESKLWWNDGIWWGIIPP